MKRLLVIFSIMFVAGCSGMHTSPSTSSGSSGNQGIDRSGGYGDGESSSGNSDDGGGAL